METKREITEKIFKITVLIQEKYPQLSSYLGEVQETLPALEHPEVDSNSLSKYYQTLETMLQDYLMEHPELEG
ncbi:hypothetical protein Q763_03860 [Flavobacterium beibuense F44-8]|uniref:Uncharacterized protein n=1 Tax=Flavobacterium beibuense F44-8 TaxID=1406840 RepID=A0A0A2M4D6_9FLAO|nr:hypothetical protein [Flavobacterium beibuense]KGO83155.1 hypothetical protein Q763_03860 [Flavobacterium beibuense F44-8]